MAGIVHIPWYATTFRGDRLEAALAEIAPVAARYGATAYFVHRSREDGYKFLQGAVFEDKLDFERYWNGPEFTRWRAVNQSYFQVPVTYAWNDIVVEGGIGAGEAAQAAAEPAEAAAVAE
jgi:quinol monooxygenase YgiN